MNKIAFTVIFSPMLMISAIQPSGNPAAEIRNEFITARLMLPDAQNGYYRCTRFDWSGQIAHLEAGGHTYFGKWFDRYDPVLHDAIMGPVEEFAPLGYDEAGPGETFVMIGIGALVKPDDKEHNRFAYYTIADHGKWKARKKSDRVEFVQRLDAGGYAYEYTKVVRLVPGKPELELSHILKNTGQKRIRTNVYNHNFLVIDEKTTGTGFKVVFPYPVEAAAGRGFGEVVHAKGNEIVFHRDLEKGEAVFSPDITGYGPAVEDFDIRIEHSDTGAGVRLTGDRPLARIVFWAAHKAISPETYVDIDVAPGGEFRWVFRYEFYSTTKR
jgi:hypothetical protein